MEVEFIAQILQLCAGRAAARSTETRLALGRLVRVGELTAQNGAVLIEAESFWRRLQALLRLLCGPVPPQNLEEDLAPTALDVLLRGMSVSDLAALIEQANTLAYAVEQCFARLVGPLDSA
ncbi:MAG: hypothetical protein LKE96_04960 [Acetobacter peroxydans]|nr:hypothetical protein [Acetobacter peroxydans]